MAALEEEKEVEATGGGQVVALAVEREEAVTEAEAMVAEEKVEATVVAVTAAEVMVAAGLVVERVAVV